MTDRKPLISFTEIKRLLEEREFEVREGKIISSILDTLNIISFQWNNQVRISRKWYILPWYLENMISGSNALEAINLKW